MALRRWKPFLGAFEHIDAAIASASAACVGPERVIPREEFKRARNRIVEALCGATDDGVAERVCLLLDDAMAESLVTLRVAHVEQNPDLLASGELVAAVGALARGHGSERVRGIVRGLMRGWRAAVEEELATATAAMHALEAASSVVGAGRGNAVKIAEPSPKTTSPITKAARNVPALRPKKTSPPAARRAPTSSCRAEDKTKMEAATRKTIAAKFR
ncbi:hypothetical protein EJB05_54317, partial [Eragrostis curvula]